MRPQSIVTFERCYLGAWLIGLVNAALNWNTMMASLDANPGVAALGPSLTTGIAIGTIVISAVITLLLWYYVARQGAVVAKWIVVVFFAIGLLSYLRGVLAGTMALGLTAVIGLVVVVLQGVAVWMLFRPDAKLWFERNAAEPTA